MTRYFVFCLDVSLPLKPFTDHRYHLGSLTLHVDGHDRLLHRRLVLILVEVDWLLFPQLCGALEHLTELDTQLVGQVFRELFPVIHGHFSLHWPADDLFVRHLSLVIRPVSRVDVAVLIEGHIAALSVTRKAF
jgi:hypothetical protein